MAKGQQPTPELRLSTSCYDANGMHINQAIDFLCDHLINFKKYKEVDIQGSNFLIEDKDFKLPMFDQNSPSKARELVKKALKEVAKTPAGRLAIWTNIHHLTYDPETKTYRSVSKDMDENDKINIFLDFNQIDASGYGYVSPLNPNIVTVYPNIIKKEINNRADLCIERDNAPKKEFNDKLREQATLFFIGATVLHEFQHTRQLEYEPLKKASLNPVYEDAGPQALSYELFLESQNKILYSLVGIPDALQEEYRKAIDYDEKTKTFNEEKAREWAINRQKNLTRDFVAPLNEKPYVDYINLSTRAAYLLKNEVYFHDAPNKKDKKAIKEYYRLANQVDITVKDILPYKAREILETKGNKVMSLCSLKEISYLEACIESRNPPKQSAFYFKDKKAYQAALDYYETHVDLDSSLVKIAILSRKIQNGDQKAIQVSAKIRAHLLKKYGIKIHTHNHFGKRIAKIKRPQGSQTMGALADSGTEVPLDRQDTEKGSLYLKEHSKNEEPFNQNQDKSRIV